MRIQKDLNYLMICINFFIGTFQAVPKIGNPSSLNLVPSRQFTSMQTTHSHSHMMCQSRPPYKLNGTLVGICQWMISLVSKITILKLKFTILQSNLALGTQKIVLCKHV